MNNNKGIGCVIIEQNGSGCINRKKVISFYTNIDKFLIKALDEAIKLKDEQCQFCGVKDGINSPPGGY